MTEKAKQLGNEPINYVGIEFNESGVPLKCFGGLTKREHFAGLAMQSLISEVKRKERDCGGEAMDYELLAAISVRCADALLEELAKTE